MCKSYITTSYILPWRITFQIFISESKLYLEVEQAEFPGRNNSWLLCFMVPLQFCAAADNEKLGTYTSRTYGLFWIFYNKFVLLSVLAITHQIFYLSQTFAVQVSTSFEGLTRPCMELTKGEF